MRSGGLRSWSGETDLQKPTSDQYSSHDTDNQSMKSKSPATAAAMAFHLTDCVGFEIPAWF